jgi:hypothetical protein
MNKEELIIKLTDLAKEKTAKYDIDHDRVNLGKAIAYYDAITMIREEL